MKLRLTLVLSLSLLAAPVLAQKVHIDYDEAADFSKYKTFAWYESSETSIADSNELMHRKLVELIQNQMQRGALRLTDSEPDLYITYHTDEKEELSLNTTSFGYGYPNTWGHYPGAFGGYGYGAYSGWGVSSAHTSVSSYTRGTLIIDVWDAREEKLVWRGSVSDIVPENPQKLEKKLERALEKMAKKWQKMYAKGA